MIRTVATIAITAVLSGGGVAVAAATHNPPAIDSIRGSAGDGYRIAWNDGSVTYSPNRSESMSECFALPKDPKKARALHVMPRDRCIGIIRTEFNWMRLMRNTLSQG